jgi:hypothetical protein
VYSIGVFCYRAIWGHCNDWGFDLCWANVLKRNCPELQDFWGLKTLQSNELTYRGIEGEGILNFRRYLGWARESALCSGPSDALDTREVVANIESRDRTLHRHCLAELRHCADWVQGLKGVIVVWKWFRCVVPKLQWYLNSKNLTLVWGLAKPDSWNSIVTCDVGESKAPTVVHFCCARCKVCSISYIGSSKAEWV